MTLKNTKLSRKSLVAMLQMLQIKRPHKSESEEEFIRKFLLDLPGIKQDEMGNLYLTIGEAPFIMYSAHTDTVHRSGGMQVVAIDGLKFHLHKDSNEDCLGADNGAGVWMLRELIQAKKPGLYIFHRGEEKGGIGSRWLAQNNPDLVKGIKAAIAFDRRGTHSVITHQWKGRCCSDKFGNSLAAGLKLGHTLDQGGSFTDTANYMDLVGECTNVSVGFSSEHSSSEELDMGYLTLLREAVINLDYSKLEYERKPGDHEPRTHTYSGWYNTHNKNQGRKKKKKKRKFSWENGYKPANDTVGAITFYPPSSGYAGSDVRSELNLGLIRRLIISNPNHVANLLLDYGIGLDELADYISEQRGYVPPEVYARRDKEENGA